MAETTPPNAAALGALRRVGAVLTEDGDAVRARIPVDVAVNRASWDARAAVHGQDAYYDSEGLIAGTVSMSTVER